MHTTTPSRPTTRPRRPVLIPVIGALTTVTGALAAVAGAGMLAVFGTSGALDSGAQPVSTRTAAVVTDVARLHDTHGISQVTGHPHLRLHVRGGDAAGVFVGIGPAAQVDTYLDGVAFDEVTDATLRPFHLARTRVAGSRTAAPPVDQHFWVASAASGGAVDLSWAMQDGRYRVVVMNADGAPVLATSTRVEVALPRATPAAVVVLAGGLALAAIGVLVLVAGLVRRPDDAAPATTAAPMSTPTHQEH